RLVVLCCLALLLFVSRDRDRLDLRSFPTRRSSDLLQAGLPLPAWIRRQRVRLHPRRLRRWLLLPRATRLRFRRQPVPGSSPVPGDRKSTRLNSSHVKISYAVFCLKKKKASKYCAKV